MNQIVTINARKYDRHIRRSWEGGLISEKEGAIILVGKFEEDVGHDELGLIKKGTVSFEFYWLDRWYNIFRFHEPDGTLRNYYCNITMPPSLENGVLDYVDLDIDVLVWPDLRYEVLDLDDFAENKIKFGYPQDVIERAEASLAEVIRLLESQEFPFAANTATDEQFQI